MNVQANEVTINGMVYIPKDAVKTTAVKDGMPYVLVRTYSAGVFVGFLSSKTSTLAGVEVELIKARRLWYWSGAASLSQLAIDGVKNPSDCKFPEELDSISLVAIEIIAVTEKAKKSIDSVAVWKA